MYVCVKDRSMKSSKKAKAEIGKANIPQENNLRYLRVKDLNVADKFKF